MSKPWVIILGVSSGFGAAIARTFAAEGHPIFGFHLDLRATRAQAVALQKELEDLGVPVRFHNANAADESRIARALDALLADQPDAKVSMLVHSLAFGTLLPFLGESEARIRPQQLSMTLNVMAHSLVWWTQAVLDRNLMGHGGRIFAMTSSGSRVVFPSYGPVSAAKCALESHVRQLAMELAPQGITVNALMAGLTDTPAFRKIPGSDVLKTRAERGNPSGRLTTPEDVARCMLSLSQPGTQWMTGNVIAVDGGETLTG